MAPHPCMAREVLLRSSVISRSGAQGDPHADALHDDGGRVGLISAHAAHALQIMAM